MTLTPCSDATAADWITTSRQWWWHLVTVGPQMFPTYTRLRFIPDPAYPGQTESDMGRPPGALEDIEQLRVAVDALLPHTSARQDGYVLLWDGWGDGQFPSASGTARRCQSGRARRFRSETIDCAASHCWTSYPGPQTKPGRLKRRSPCLPRRSSSPQIVPGASPTTSTRTGPSSAPIRPHSTRC